jgi:hypothetical protein
VLEVAEPEPILAVPKVPDEILDATVVSVVADAANPLLAILVTAPLILLVAIAALVFTIALVIESSAGMLVVPMSRMPTTSNSSEAISALSSVRVVPEMV